MKVLRFAILSISIILLVLYIHFTEGFSGVISAINNLDYRYLSLAFLMPILVFFWDALAKHIIRRKFDKAKFGYSFYNVCFSYSSYNLIPAILQVGGATEISLMTKQGMSVSDASSAILYRQTLSFIGATLIPFALVYSNRLYFVSRTNYILRLFFIIGLLINIITSVLYASVGTWDKFLYSITRNILKAGSKIKIVKNYNEACQNAYTSIQDLKVKVKNMPFSKRDTLLVLLVLAMQSFSAYASSYFIAKALRVELNVSAITLMAACSFVVIVQTALPIPGGLGLADFAYIDILSEIVGSKINIMMMIWRIVTFYFPAIISIITMSIPFDKIRKKSVEIKSL